MVSFDLLEDTRYRTHESITVSILFVLQRENEKLLRILAMN